MMESSVNTGSLLSNIRNASSLEAATAYHRSHPDPTFLDLLNALMERKKQKPVDIIQASGIERSYFYHILDGKKNPGRNMVLRIAICMNCKLEDINQLLRLSGYATLYPKIRRDAIIIYAISKNMSMSEVNDLLFSENQEPMYRKDQARQ